MTSVGQGSFNALSETTSAKSAVGLHVDVDGGSSEQPVLLPEETDHLVQMLIEASESINSNNNRDTIERLSEMLKRIVTQVPSMVMKFLKEAIQLSQSPSIARERLIKIPTLKFCVQWFAARLSSLAKDEDLSLWMPVDVFLLVIEQEPLDSSRGAENMISTLISSYQMFPPLAPLSNPSSQSFPPPTSPSPSSAVLNGVSGVSLNTSLSSSSSSRSIALPSGPSPTAKKRLSISMHDNDSSSASPKRASTMHPAAPGPYLYSYDSFNGPPTPNVNVPYQLKAPPLNYTYHRMSNSNSNLNTSTTVTTKSHAFQPIGSHQPSSVGHVAPPPGASHNSQSDLMQVNGGMIYNDDQRSSAHAALNSVQTPILSTSAPRQSSAAPLPQPLSLQPYVKAAGKPPLLPKPSGTSSYPIAFHYESTSEKERLHHLQRPTPVQPGIASAQYTPHMTVSHHQQESFVSSTSGSQFAHRPFAPREGPPTSTTTTNTAAAGNSNQTHQPPSNDSVGSPQNSHVASSSSSSLSSSSQKSHHHESIYGPLVMSSSSFPSNHSGGEKNTPTMNNTFASGLPHNYASSQISNNNNNNNNEIVYRPALMPSSQQSQGTFSTNMIPIHTTTANAYDSSRLVENGFHRSGGVPTLQDRRSAYQQHTTPPLPSSTSGTFPYQQQQAPTSLPTTSSTTMFPHVMTNVYATSFQQAVAPANSKMMASGANQMPNITSYQQCRGNVSSTIPPAPTSHTNSSHHTNLYGEPPLVQVSAAVAGNMPSVSAYHLYGDSQGSVDMMQAITTTTTKTPLLSYNNLYGESQKSFSSSAKVTARASQQHQQLSSQHLYGESQQGSPDMPPPLSARSSQHQHLSQAAATQNNQNNNSSPKTQGATSFSFTTTQPAQQQHLPIPYSSSSSSSSSQPTQFPFTHTAPHSSHQITSLDSQTNTHSPRTQGGGPYPFSQTSAGHHAQAQVSTSSSSSSPRTQGPSFFGHHTGSQYAPVGLKNDTIPPHQQQQIPSSPRTQGPYNQACLNSKMGTPAQIGLSHDTIIPQHTQVVPSSPRTQAPISQQLGQYTGSQSGQHSGVGSTSYLKRNVGPHFSSRADNSVQQTQRGSGSNVGDHQQQAPSSLRPYESLLPINYLNSNSKMGAPAMGLHQKYGTTHVIPPRAVVGALANSSTDIGLSVKEDISRLKASDQVKPPVGTLRGGPFESPQPPSQNGPASSSAPTPPIVAPEIPLLEDAYVPSSAQSTSTPFPAAPSAGTPSSSSASSSSFAAVVPHEDGDLSAQTCTTAPPSVVPVVNPTSDWDAMAMWFAQQEPLLADSSSDMMSWAASTSLLQGGEYVFASESLLDISVPPTPSLPSFPIP